MADVQTNIAQSKKSKRGRNILIAIILLIIIIALFFWLSVRAHNKLMAQIQDEIDKEAAAYGANKDQARRLIIDAAAEIISDRSQRKLAAKLADELNISYDQAIVDMAMARLRSLKYLE
jgi:putative lipase involved disintegration of autophagic bodies